MFMAYGFRKTLNVFIICLMMIFTGCGNVEEVSLESIEEEITTEVTEEITTEISETGNMDKILFYATISYNY